MKPNKQEKIIFVNDCNCCVDYDLLELEDTKCK